MVNSRWWNPRERRGRRGPVLPVGVRLTRRVREEYRVYFDRNATMSGAQRRGSGGMDRRPNAAWVSSPAVWAGWIAARTPPGFHHRLFTPLQPATAGTPASGRRHRPERRETAHRRSPAEAARRQSPEESGENPPQQNRSPPIFVPIRGVPPRENRTFEGLRRPPAPRAEPRAEPGTRRTAARLSPTPERRRRPEVRRLFSPLQSHPAAGAWLSLAEHLVRDQGVAGSNPAAPTRPVPQTVPADGSGRRVPPDGFRQTGSARRVPPDGSPRRVPAPRRPRHPAVRTHFFPPPSHPGKGWSFRHSPMVQNVYISALLPETVRPGGCPFSCSCFLTFPKRV